MTHQENRPTRYISRNVRRRHYDDKVAFEEESEPWIMDGRMVIVYECNIEGRAAFVATLWEFVNDEQEEVGEVEVRLEELQELERGVMTYSELVEMVCEQLDFCSRYSDLENQLMDEQVLFGSRSRSGSTLPSLQRARYSVYSSNRAALFLGDTLSAVSRTLAATEIDEFRKQYEDNDDDGLEYVVDFFVGGKADGTGAQYFTSDCSPVAFKRWPLPEQLEEVQFWESQGRSEHCTGDEPQ